MTGRGQSVPDPETLRERVRRERPDTAQRPSHGPAGGLVDGDTGEDRQQPEVTGVWDADGDGLCAEEEAVHIRLE